MDLLRLEHDIAEVVGSVCTTVLGAEATRTGASPPTPGTRTLVGCVQITGAWSGAVLLSCAPGFAERAAATIFAGPEKPSVEEERDALGELTNMVAGNLKSLLPGPSFLGLPTVADGIDGVLEVLGTSPVKEVQLEVAGQRVTVVLLARAEDS